MPRVRRLRREAPALELLAATLPELRLGLYETAARTVAYEVFEKLGFGAVAVTDTARVLAFVGAGADHHAAGDEPIRPVFEALAADETRVAPLALRVACRHPARRLGASRGECGAEGAPGRDRAALPLQLPEHDRELHPHRPGPRARADPRVRGLLPLDARPPGRVRLARRGARARAQLSRSRAGALRPAARDRDRRAAGRARRPPASLPRPAARRERGQAREDRPAAAAPDSRAGPARPAAGDRSRQRPRDRAGGARAGARAGVRRG